MGTVLCTMGLIGAWMGWQVRLGNGGTVNALTLGDTIRETHPKIMAGMVFFFVLGGQGGLVRRRRGILRLPPLDARRGIVTQVLNAAQGNAVLASPHAFTALASLGLLAVEAALPLAFEKGPQLRAAHAYLGSAIMLLLFGHLALGVQLGTSF